MKSYYRKNLRKNRTKLRRHSDAGSISGVRRHKSSLKKENRGCLLSRIIILIALTALIAANIYYFYRSYLPL